MNCDVLFQGYARVAKLFSADVKLKTSATMGPCCQCCVMPEYVASSTQLDVKPMALQTKTEDAWTLVILGWRVIF